MYFQPYYLGCLSHASYLIAGSNGEAAVIDPRRDVDEYLKDAAEAGLEIRHVIETHLHADFVSGHMELARRTGATIYLGEGSGAAFPHHPVADGDVIRLGDLRLTFLRTPGHTPEGVTILAQSDGDPAPRYAFTGDTLFIGDVGRPDLVGAVGYTAEQMAGMLYHSLREKILPLPDAIEIWPAHGAGSACGKKLSEEHVSTLRRQKAENIALRFVIDGDEEGFVRYATEGLDQPPAYFFHDAAKNREGAPTVDEVISQAAPLTPAEVEAMSEGGILVLDGRAADVFRAGHIPGALSVPLDGSFAPWVGAVVPPMERVIVVADPERIHEEMTRLARVGYENIAGWLDGGMDAWTAAGGEVQRVSPMSPAALREAIASAAPPAVLDVRTNAEWEAGHIPGALHIPLPELSARTREVPTDNEVAVICGSGYRSGIAVSILQRAGRDNLRDVLGGWKAWNAPSSRRFLCCPRGVQRLRSRRTRRGTTS